MLSRLLTEISSRRVLRTAGAYLAATLLLLRLAERLGPLFGATELFHQVLALVLTAGFPVFITLAWRSKAAGEATTENGGSDRPSKIEIPDGEDGLKIPVLARTRVVDVALLVVLIAVGYLYAERFVESKPSPENVEVAAPIDVPQASIAVLPFENFSSDEAFAYFAAGVHEDVLTYLSRVPGLLVISRTSVMHYRGSAETIPQIARALGVAHVLEGSVRRAGNRVRITVQLIRAKGDAHLWAENYDRDLTDVFAIQTEVAEAVADTLSTKLSPAVLTNTGRLPTEDPQAYDWFVQGREMIRLPSATSAHEGLALFERAIDRDPDYADAHAGVALALKKLTSFDLVWQDVRERAIESARRAIALEPRSPYAEYVMGILLTGLGEDNASAEAHLKRAIELDPNSGDAYLAYSENLYIQSRYEESFVQIREAAKRDPLSPEVQLYQGKLLLMAGKPAEALDHIARAIELNPDSAFSHLVAGHAYASGNELLSALGHYGQARALDPSNSETAGAIAGALTRLNILPAARAWLEEQRRLAPAGDEWYFRQSQLLVAEGLHQALDSLAADWERYNPNSHRTVQLRATAASLKGLAGRANDDPAAAGYSERAVVLLKEFLSAFATPEGYRPQFNNLWSLISLGLEERGLGDESGSRHFQAVVDLYESQPADVQLPNQRTHLLLCYAALGEREKALENMRLSLESGDYTYWVFPIFDLEVDKSGFYHGITEDAEFQRLLAAMRDDAAQKEQRLTREFPAMLDPSHADWQNPRTIATSAAGVSGRREPAT